MKTHSKNCNKGKDHPVLITKLTENYPMLIKSWGFSRDVTLHFHLLMSKGGILLNKHTKKQIHGRKTLF